MKKFFVAAMLALTVATSAFATDTKITAAVLTNFKSDFKYASNVTWAVRTDFTKASFTIGDTKMEAFYTSDGDKIGVSKNISINELPTNAKRTYVKKYADFVVKEAIYFEGTEENAYYISADSDTESVIVKVDENSNLSVYKKTKK